jgi:hypothetical protein
LRSKPKPMTSYRWERKSTLSIKWIGTTLASSSNCYWRLIEYRKCINCLQSRSGKQMSSWLRNIFPSLNWNSYQERRIFMC